MSLPKVYLAKSNRANPNLVTRVRQALSKFEIEIVEFTGGQFSHKPMLECEYLVVVPDLSGEEIVIGKGLFEQIDRFQIENGWDNVLVVAHDDHEDIPIREIGEIEIIDYDNYVSYAVIEFVSSWGCEELTEILSKQIGYSQKKTDSYSTKTGDSNYYHLIGRKK